MATMIEKIKKIKRGCHEILINFQINFFVYFATVKILPIYF